MNFADRLIEKINEKESPLCVGIDPRPENLPQELKDKWMAELPGDVWQATLNATEEWCIEVVNAVKDEAAVVKPQYAFFEIFGAPGIEMFEKVRNEARGHGLLVIGDGKRNDIGATAEYYSRAHLGRIPLINGAEITGRADLDALTVNAYLGIDGVDPFIKDCTERGKGIFVLVKTSNKSSGDIQDLEGRFEGKEGKVYERMAQLVDAWGAPLKGEQGYSPIGAVVGVTKPEEARAIREIMPSTFILGPGFGAQGGTAEDAVIIFGKDGYGAIINSSRGVIFAYERGYKDYKERGWTWQDAVKHSARDSKVKIVNALKEAKKLPSGWK
ncbi:orotidine-5'-phosphate decarboxylase [Candidatus Woesearchaeota archaeon]|nr:orotidine-5'-phosphate decarboxylase [Candidatus Woesearchaeota archaeon]MBW3006385.1 orotidine-5'-phosphate decarboxylase [Candidatus Woesearchaeota archaeon]